MISIEISWARAATLDGQPALSVLSRIEKDGQFVDKVQHVIPLADLERFNPPLSVWQLIEVACAPAAEAQQRRDRATAAAIAKRARRRSKILRTSWRAEDDARLARMAGALH